MPAWAHPREPCTKCGGDGVTDRTEYGVELDENGNQVPVTRHTTQQCDMCGGTGEASE